MRDIHMKKVELAVTATAVSPIFDGTKAAD